jgi:C4-dicarboxylate transporter DctM subunit
MADPNKENYIQKPGEIENGITPLLFFFKWIGGVIDNVNLIGGYLSGICIFFIALFVTYDIICRFVLNAPTTWVLETSIYLCIASLFLAGGYILKQRSHINVDVIINILPRLTKLKLELLTSVLAFIYCIVLAWEGGKITLGAYISGETSPTLLRFPIFIPRGLVSLGGILLCLQFVKEFGSLIMQIKNISYENDPIEPTRVKRAVPVLFVVLLVVCSLFLVAKGLSLVGLVLLLFLLLFSGLPVGFAMGFLGILGLYSLFGGSSMMVQVPLIAYKNVDDFIMVAVPLFVMTASVLMAGRIGSDLFEVAGTWTRHLPGGLAVSSILACAIFAAISGSSSATVVTIGSVALPEMISRGYKRELVYGTLAIGGVLGPLIPPSMFMILIGAMTGDSVGKLFMAGMLPGIMLAIIFSAYLILKCWKDPNVPKMPKASWKERFHVLRTSAFGLFTPVIILVGIYTGVFTPTEAAAVSTVYGLFVCVFLYRTIKWKEFAQVLRKSAETSGMILFIVIGAMTFGQVVAMLQIPEKVVDTLGALPISPMAVLGIVLVFILILGALMDEASILLITYPIVYTLFVTHFGFDSIWFALVFVFTLEVGLVAPPVGLNLFVIQGIDKTSTFAEVVRGVLPFMLLMIVSILLVVYIKPLSTWLPRTIG